MRSRIAPLALILAACSGPRRGADRNSQSDSAQQRQARATPAAAFRVPAGGGPLHVYELPAMEATPWGTGSRLAGARVAVGTDLIGRRLLFRDSVDAIASFDLVSLRQKTVGPRHAAATIAADGALLVVDSATGAVTESQPWGTRVWPTAVGRGVRAVFAAPGPRLLAVRHTRAGDTLSVVGRESGVSESRPVPGANDIVSSRDGDAIAFATDSGVVVYEDRAMDHPWFVHTSAAARALTFSPSGHRIYVALKDKSELAVIDRFGKNKRGSVDLPGPAGSLRADPWGRVVLVRGSEQGTDETWVVGVARNKVTGRIKNEWASDLPTVSQSGVLLSREAGNVIARDVHSLDSLGSVDGGAGDLWFAGRWTTASSSAMARGTAQAGIQNDRQTTISSHAAPTRTPGASTPATSRSTASTPAATSRTPVAPVTTAARPTTPAPSRTPAVTTPAAPVPTFFAQLLATRSEDAARSLAASLAPEPVKVEAPRAGLGDDNWRVLAGPFRSREQADSAGRSLGRPYWVVDRTRETTARP